MAKLLEGDLVACYLTNTEVVEKLFAWGIVLEVTDTLQDVLVLDNAGETRWWPSKRWRKLDVQTHEKTVDFFGFLA